MKDDLEFELKKIWRKILNIDENTEITSKTDFFEEGGNSLHISIMLDMIQEKFGIKISPDVIYSNPTFGELQAAIK